ncbi:hypothetical protein CsSME_00033877 [Camellia sinensis var. sinensis]
MAKEDIGMKFPTSCGTSNLPFNYSEMEKQIKEMKWKKERIPEDMQRQQYVKFLVESSSYATQLSYLGEHICSLCHVPVLTLDQFCFGLHDAKN